MITSFVLVMMLLIEYITVLTKGKWSIKIQNSAFLQILLAALLGAIPGCLGTYTAVTLYAHGIFNFAAIVTAMISTSGDEAFVMLSVMPKTAILIILVIFIISIISGLIVYAFFRNKNFMNTRHFMIRNPVAVVLKKALYLFS
ncbi:putative manganese transporter [Bacteroidota bacterium]